MRIAVVQHSLRQTAEDDADALLAAAVHAVGQGASVVILPEVANVHHGPLLDEWWQRVSMAVPNAGVLVPHVGSDHGSIALEAELDPLGKVALLSGDAAIDPEVLGQTALRTPDVVVLGPRSESELQAEAVLELALACSLAIASLVIVVDPDGALPGEPGHGGSAIAYLGEMAAEAIAGDDILFADIDTPLSGPEPSAAMPRITPILEQRLAAHHGRKVDVPYPAELS